MEGHCFDGELPMLLKNLPDTRFLPVQSVLSKIQEALETHTPFSLIRIGDGENIVLAQGTFLTPEELLDTHWVKRALRKPQEKGIPIPCYKLRDQFVKVIPKANLIGICAQNQKLGDAPLKFCRAMTNKLFEYYSLEPQAVCNVWINRQIVTLPLFWILLQRYRTLLISKWAEDFANLITRKYAFLRPNIAGCINFTHFDQIGDTLNAIKQVKFDLALVSAGVNAVVLAVKIAERFGKVALDFGKTMGFMLHESQTQVNPWQPFVSGPKTLDRGWAYFYY